MTYGPRFWIGVVLGWCVMTFGIIGLFVEAERTHPDQWVRWFIGAALVHDLLVAPIVFLVGRFADRWGSVVRNGVVASAILTLVAYPLVRGYGRNPMNPTILPSNYALNLVVVLGVVWSVVGVTLLVASLQRQR